MSLATNSDKEEIFVLETGSTL